MTGESVAAAWLGLVCTARIIDLALGSGTVLGVSS